MGKRVAEATDQASEPLKRGDRPEQAPEKGADAEEFEDEFEDEFESEDEIFEAGVDGRPDEEREAEEQRDGMDLDAQTFIPGRHKLGANEVLSPDLSTYEMLHTLSTNWPCLSFDILPDALGAKRTSYPATLYAVAGTQASAGREKENELLVMKLSGLSRMDRPDPQSDSDDSESDDEDAEPILESKSIPLSSTTNRIRAHQTPQLTSSAPPTTLTATMTESGAIHLHDITPHLTSFDTPGTVLTPQNNKPISTLRMHKSTEGYALDWSPLHPAGKLVTGDNAGNIFTTTSTDGGGWATDTRPFTGHTSSVEELQWSPSERSVFASASSDGSVKVWDVRSKSHSPALSVPVSTTDVNVMSWSRQTTHLLSTGADDGAWAVWDLRQWKPTSSSAPTVQNPAKSAVASFTFHTAPITSIEWHPTDDSVVAVGSADSTLTLWDLAVELDDDESRDTAGVRDVPPQLLFVHYMESVKECHWHAQIPGLVVGTGAGGFGVFKTISV
ncbi:MAG: ribosome biosynthesis protein rrb1 [Piccolia ochrophora]|nr:MAG: ribosome biosynthesis protein rrb1 [Piccolia ochrophora]